MLAFELSQAFRRLFRQPLWAAAVVGTLALSIGASTAIFSLLYGVLLRPLPYPEAERLVRVYETYDELRTSPNPRLQAIWNRLPLSHSAAVELGRQNGILESLGLFAGISATLEVGAEPERVAGAEINGGLLEALGVSPSLGRVFTVDEIQAGERVVLLAHDLWAGPLGGREDVLGESLRLDEELYSIIGVMPRSFQLPGRKDDRLWTPLGLGELDSQERVRFSCHAVARLQPGMGADLAGTLLAEGLGAWPEAGDGAGLRILPLTDDLLGDQRPRLLLLFGAIGLIFLIGCVNVLHLVLARNLAARREMAIHRALGAGWGTLALRQISEIFLLAVGGGAFGFLLACWGHRTLLSWLPEDLPRKTEIVMDGQVLAFALLLSLPATILCAGPAAWSNSRWRIRDVLGSTGVSRRGRPSGHEAFVVAQIALSLTLVVGAALLLRSFFELSAVEPGFRSEGLLAQEVRLPESRYESGAQREAFAAGLLQELGTLPGVRSAALTTQLPFEGRSMVWGFRILGRDSPTERSWIQGRSAVMKFVTPGYLPMLGLSALDGRDLQPTDLPERGRVVLINETLAAMHWPGGDAVGQQVILSTSEAPYTVVGVVADVRHNGLHAKPGAMMYQPWSQGPALTFTVVVRAVGDPETFAPAVRRTVRKADPLLPLAPASTLDALLEASLTTPRSRTALLMALAILAVALAGVGIFAVVSFTVQQRQKELGIRLALGARPATVRRWIFRRILRLVLLGLILGIPAAFLVGSLLQTLLFGVTPRDPAAFGGAAILLAAAALLSGLVPALRAGQVDPLAVLRSE